MPNPILTAARDGDLAAFEFLLESEPDCVAEIDDMSDEGASALMIAAAAARLPMVAALLRAARTRGCCGEDDPADEESEEEDDDDETPDLLDGAGAYDDGGGGGKKSSSAASASGPSSAAAASTASSVSSERKAQRDARAVEKMLRARARALTRRRDHRAGRDPSAAVAPEVKRASSTSRMERLRVSGLTTRLARGTSSLYSRCARTRSSSSTHEGFLLLFFFS